MINHGCYMGYICGSYKSRFFTFSKSRQGESMKINKKGFTLIELLVVVLIIGILAAIALPQYKLSVARSRLSNILQTFATIKNAQELYYSVNNVYSDMIETLDVDLIL